MRSLPILLALGLTFGVASAARPSSEASGGRIVYASRSDIWSMRPDGRGVRRLTRNQREEACPSWSPNGRWIAFTRRGVRPPDVYVMRADGSGQRRVAQTLGTDMCPAWSPDGRRLVFVILHAAVNGGFHDVFTIGVNGRGLRKLTRQQEAWEVAAWSRRGRIAYVNTRSPLDGSDIWTMRPDGSDRRQLTRAVSEWNTEPDWSPDGGRIAYVSDLQSYGAVQIMNADGSGVRRLTNETVPEGSPSWSRDGRKLVFVRNGQIYTMNADGSGVRQLTHARYGVAAPDWGPAPR